MALRVAVVGAGYWGPNLIRNFQNSSDWDLVAVCDLDEKRARGVVGDHSTVRVETSLCNVLSRDDVDAVAIATPAATHKAIAIESLLAGKHVLVEKPLASSLSDAEEMLSVASQRGLTLMCDHTYCYTPAVQAIADIISRGDLGDILYVDCIRINLGLIQPDVDVFWDLAPHDLSILDYILPGGLNPQGVAAHGADPMRTGKACVGYLTLPMPSGAIVHAHVNWLSPTKIRQMVVGGSRRTLVWDDLNPQQRISIYDRGVDFAVTAEGTALPERRAANISYRLGDMHAPAVAECEPLGAMVSEFAAAVRDGRDARTDGSAGVRVLSVLEAASESLRAGGLLVQVKPNQLLVEEMAV